MHFVREKRDKGDKLPRAGAFMRDEGGELFERSIERCENSILYRARLNRLKPCPSFSEFSVGCFL
jgi:hypothetical protein